MQQAFTRGALRFARSVAGLADPAAFQAFLATLRASDWVVYAKPPFAGPPQVLEYRSAELATKPRALHPPLLRRAQDRVAISNDRLVSVAAGQVRFRWKDYAHGNRLKTMTLSADEFLQRFLDGARDRFLLHVLPSGFVRIRHFGFLALSRSKGSPIGAARRSWRGRP